MGTEVLRPQDCLMRPGPSLLPRRKPNPSQKPLRKPSSSSSPRPEAKKRREGSPKPAKTGAAAGSRLVMGQVTILKRGEPLDSRRAESEAGSDARHRASGGGVGGCWDPEVFGTGRLGPDPAVIPKQIRVVDLRLVPGGRQDVYAGSAFDLSPSPRALPLPRFAARRSGGGGGSAATTVTVVDSSATEDLRRMLRLD